MNLRLALVLPLVLAGSGPWATAVHPASAQDSPLDRYIRMGLEANRTLTQQEIEERKAEARWEASRASYLPSLEFEARYSRADGGRVFDVPVGDLLNPVYTTLNDLTGTRDFPPVQNQRFPLLRDPDQDTRLRVTQVIWQPAAWSNARSKRRQWGAAKAGTDAARRTVVRDVRVAYYQYANALRAEEILETALELMQENERSSQRLYQAALATRDEVHRARAERLEVEAQGIQARADRELAASYLRYLIGRGPETRIEVSDEDLSLPSSDRVNALRDATAAPAGGMGIDTLTARSQARRPELEQLDRAVEAAEAAVGAARAVYKPSLALFVEAGVQGRDYGVGPEFRFLLASLVLSWTITDGGGHRARAREAGLELERLRSQREEAAARIRLELERAAYNARGALLTLASSAERVEEAEDAFLAVRRRREEGLATSLEFLDARSNLTRAQLSQNISETTALVRLAELEYATGETLDILPSSAEDPR